jgi:cysteinyl-tRNA synthetase
MTASFTITVCFRVKRGTELIAGARVAPDEDKDDPVDFALWKAAKPERTFLGKPLGARATRLAH